MDIGIEDIRRITMSLPGDTSVYEVVDGKLEALYFSEAIPALSGMDAEEYHAVIADDASAIVVEPDRPLVAAKLMQTLTTGEDTDLSYRILHKTRGAIWVHARARLLGQRNGHPVLLCLFGDTSNETALHEELLDNVAEAIHVVDAQSMELLYLNKTARETWGCHGDFQGKTCYAYLHRRETACPWCGMAAATDENVDAQALYDADVERYFDWRRRILSWHGRKAYAVFATDVTENARARKVLLEEKGRLETIIEHIPAGVCVYRIDGGATTLVAANEYLRDVLQTDSGEMADLHAGPLVGRVHPEDRMTASRASKELMGGNGHASCEFRIQDVHSGEYRWLHLDGLSMPQADGAEYVFAAITDITARKLQEERYRLTMGDLLVANPQALCAFEINLTANTCGGGRGISEFAQSALASDTADGAFANIAALIVDGDESEECRQILNRRVLIEKFESGVDHLSIEYRRRADEDTVIWAKTFVSLMRNPSTGDIEAVLYSENIDDRKLRELANHIVTESSYDFIALIDLRTSTLRFLEVRALALKSFRDDAHSGKPRPYEDARRWTLETWVHSDDKDLYSGASSLEAIKTALDEKDTYEFAIRSLRPDGDVRRKRLQYAYLDSTRESVVLWQSDITEAFAKAQKDARRLEVALSAAKQASNAKSVFLSRMSHEIRTPMNAIIGMDALAAQAIGNDERVADCLSKIGISSRYLLSLINDILDMSRIESGKMMLNNESFLVRDLVTGVNDIIYSQAEAKGLDYECVVASEVVEAYIGDSMKLQQILVNLLGNAVKFTEKGKVSLSIQQPTCNKDQAKLRFIVNDTGRGVTSEDQKRIFDPFEQGDTSTTTVFGGTGLGLAITKSLVELMGGTIRLRSIVGVGSEFTVDVPLTIDMSVVCAVESVHHFEKMRTLVVDDDLIVCEQTQRIMKDIGMVGEWVTSGYEALERVKQMALDKTDYDFILVDWKMPDMNGIETTRRIRGLVGPDVTIIIITAYDWQSIEVEAKAAGANLLVSKPLFKETLVSAFEKAQGRIDEKVLDEVEYDFTGKRALVAEDNAINAEIATELLKSKSFTVEVAHDGLEALEMFTKSSIGYYDVILMDVRMPQMDGLQATSNIRRWNKEDAKTVPIIAMTANAFDEDVEKSRAAGMNAHLAKPIEPNVLFRTLYRILEGEDGF